MERDRKKPKVRAKGRGRKRNIVRQRRKQRLKEAAEKRELLLGWQELSNCSDFINIHNERMGPSEEGFR